MPNKHNRRKPATDQPSVWIGDQAVFPFLLTENLAAPIGVATTTKPCPPRAWVHITKERKEDANNKTSIPSLG